MKNGRSLNRKVKLGIVGCGYWGPNLIRNFIQIPKASLKIACDIDKKRLKRVNHLFPFLETTQNFDDLLKDGLDAIIVATPLRTHFDYVKKALEKGKHVLVEKPFVATPAQAKSLIDIAESAGLTLMIDNTFEYAAAVNKIKKLVLERDLGEIYTVDMIRVNLGLFQKDHNAVIDLAYHDISILLYIFEEMPKSVVAVGQDFIQNGIEDSAYIILKFPRKLLASIHVSWLDPYKIRRITFVGSKKMLVFDDTEATEKIKIFNKGVSVKKKIPKMKHFESFSEFSYLYRTGDIFIPKLNEEEPLKLMSEHFIQCVTTRTTPRSNGNVGLKILKIITAVNKSLKEGGREIIIHD